MGKVTKKTKKFIKKHLRSVIKNRQKFKSVRDSRRRRRGLAGSGEADVQNEELVGGQLLAEDKDDTSPNIVGNSFLDGLVSEDDDITAEDDSGSDIYFSEDPDCPYISGSDVDDDLQEKSGNLTLGEDNNEIYLNLAQQKKRLNRLKKKDPYFSEFLERHKHTIEHLGREDNYSDEYVERNDQRTETNEEQNDTEAKSISCSTLDVWCWLVMEEANTSALSGLLNAYRAACHYCLDDPYENSQQKFSNGKAFSKILTFMLYEADGIFRRLLGISESCHKENILKLKNTSQWQTTSRFIKSYLRSTLFLLNQHTDNNILVFALSQLRDSVIYFSAFPLLVRSLVKVVVHIWATGEESLFLSSFLLMKEMSLKLSPDCHEVCLTRTYKAYIVRCKFVEPENLMHLEHIGDSIVELFSLDVHKSYQKVSDSLHQLAGILHQALRTKKKEEFRKLYSWQFIKCIDIWVKFISLNIRDYDLQRLLYMLIQLIRGVAQLFPGPRYLPLRFKCVQMLNQLSSASGVFIPVIYLVLDFLEYGEKAGKNSKKEKSVNISSVLKVPKAWLKSQEFQEICVLSSIELLSAHFSQWSYHICFPDLATIPLILLKSFYKNLAVENIRRSVKRLIDQVERNSEFVQRKRDQISFSINDRASIESFLQMEKSSNNAPFTMYYNSICQNAASKNNG